jgi:predicted ribosome quality control (RQC) complex YloA/Tae2 family protein
MITSIEVRFLLREIKDKLIDSKVQAVTQITKNGFCFELYKQNKFFLYCLLDKGLFLSKKKVFEAQKPSSFCIKLRKELVGRKIKSINQHEFDRIVKIKINEHELIFEFFWKGNLILVKDKILAAFLQRDWKDRSIKVGKKYEYPPSPINPLKITEAKLRKLIGKKKIVKFLASDLGLGGEVAEKICEKVNINKEKIKLTNEEVEKLAKFLQNLEKNLKNDYRNVNETLRKRIEEVITKESKSKEEEVKERIKRIEKQQKEAIRKWKQKEELCRKIGKILYEKYLEVKKQIEEGKKKITIDNLTFEIDPNKTIQQNAAIYFEKAKKAKKKLEKLKKVIKIKGEIKVEKREHPKKREWYDKFRWFISSDGFLIVAGKDAKTNEQLIRKYMKDDDLVFHADITGSPFALIKKGKNAPKQTIEEAAMFTACYSKAWKVGLASMDVYYVNPEQVSKKAPAGEYIPKGAFMIYGKKNWKRRVELKLAIGVKDREIVYGPEIAVRKKTKRFVTIVPGEKNVKELKEEIEKKLGASISLEELQRIVPYGKGFVK